jgi:PKD repeat protein
MTLSITGTVDCTVTPNLCSTCCNGKSWQIKDDDTGDTICSGTISKDAFCPNTCNTWQVEEGTHNYTLYIGGVAVANDSVTCPGASNIPPTCDYLSASPATGTAPLAVSFLGSGIDSDGFINQYEFDFGDGSPLVYSTTTGVTHTYNATGTYCAKLRVKDNNGTWSANTGNCPGGVCTAQITVTGGGPVISSPSVVTNPATNIASTTVTLNGNLLSLGYDPGICPTCKTIVWFEWVTSGQAGVSGSYGSSTLPITVNTPGPFLAVVSLTSGQTYYFEAFAKNGGSW